MTVAARPASWKWWVCGLLLLASAINYMDRQTLANAAVRITTQFGLSQQQYGRLEWVFGWAFAVGSLLFGIAVDRFSVRWLYPLVLLLWSIVGFSTGLVHSYSGLLVCRTLLGLFEGGHWPCAIKTTQRLLESKDRAMGNGVLQGGTSIGAIITPLVLRAMLTEELGSWRLAFQVVGAMGLLWIVAWFALVRSHDLRPAPRPAVSAAGPGEIWSLLFSRRMLVLFAVVACINASWQTLRAWLPKFLQQGRAYTETDTLYFNSLFYIATDVGCLGAGALTLWLVRRGRSVHGSRLFTFLGCAGLCALALLIPFLPKGWTLLGILLLVGAGALGVFPVYHAFTQELSNEHQGKVTGVASIAAWAVAPPAQEAFGWLIDRTHSFDVGLAVAGGLPMLAFFPLWWFWNKTPEQTRA